jgi:uncharacterized membrane protein YidH (DUF202 family)
MTDPVGFLLLAILGTAALTVAIVGLRRGRSVSLVAPLRFDRTENPLPFWTLVAVQLAVAISCVIGAIRAV